MPLLTNKVVWQTHFVAADATDATDSRVNQFMQTRDPLTLGQSYVRVCVQVYIHAKSHYPTPLFPPGHSLNITHTSHKPLTKHAIGVGRGSGRLKRNIFIAVRNSHQQQQQVAATSRSHNNNASTTATIHFGH